MCTKWINKIISTENGITHGANATTWCKACNRDRFYTKRGTTIELQVKFMKETKWMDGRPMDGVEKFSETRTAFGYCSIVHMGAQKQRIACPCMCERCESEEWNEWSRLISIFTNLQQIYFRRIQKAKWKWIRPTPGNSPLPPNLPPSPCL